MRLPRDNRKLMLSLGGISPGLSAVSVAALLWTSSVEQARSPGEKDLGVAVLGMIFIPPALFFALAGIATFGVAAAIWIYRVLRQKSEYADQKGS